MDEENNSTVASMEPGSIELSITPVEPVSARNMLEALFSCFLTVARSSSLITYRNLVVIMLWVAEGLQECTSTRR